VTPKLAKKKPKAKKLSAIDELDGKLKPTNEKNKLMNSVMENDKETIDDAKLIKDSLNQSMGAFSPDLMFEQFVKDYSLAKNIYGDSILKHLSGYDEKYIEKNIQIPEFQREMKKKINEKIKDLKKKNFIDKSNTITEKGIELASLVMYVEEIDRLQAHGFLGEKFHKKESYYGDKVDYRNYRKGDRYRDISTRRSVKLAVRRGHDKLRKEDLRVNTREAKGKCEIIYALDSSGSMKGKKIDTCKKAGIALAFKAIEEKDDVGLIIFGKEVSKSVAPCDDFGMFLKEISQIKAMQETSITCAVKKSVELFSSLQNTKHLILLTDALPTVGEDPEKETLNAVEEAANNDITISLIGISLDDKGTELAEKIVSISKGKLYIVQDVEEIDKIVLEDYYGLS